MSHKQEQEIIADFKTSNKKSCGESDSVPRIGSLKIK